MTAFIIFYLLLIALSVLMCLQESRKREINFFVALLICALITPLVGYFIILAFPLRNPRGCQWCGNTKNEAEYCGICGKNALGELKPG